MNDDVRLARPGRNAPTRDAAGGLRIAYLFMRYPVGAQPFAISDVQALARLGNRVDTYALSGWDREHQALLETYAIDPGPRAYPSLATLLAPMRPSSWPKLWRLLRFLARHHRDWGSSIRALVLVPRIVEVAVELERLQPDVVHAFWGHYPSLLIPLVADSNPNTVRSVFLGAYDLTSHLAPFAAETARLCHTVWTHAEENRPLLAALGLPEDKIGVVHRGIPLDLADGEQPAREHRRLCTAANLQKEKNVDLVLRSFARLLEREPGATLTVIGDGSERKALEALAARLGIADRVTFTGRLSRAALFREMARSRVFLFLSTKVSERLPNVVKEAMLAGCHCLVSRTAGIEELVEHGRTGEILTDLDPEAVAERVGLALDSETSPEIAAAGSRFVRERFSSEASMARYAETWRSVLRPTDAGLPDPGPPRRRSADDADADASRRPAPLQR